MFKVTGLGFRLGYTVQGSAYRVQDSGYCSVGLGVFI